MARAAIYEQSGEPAYVSGLRVHTTIKRKDQEAANEGLRQGVLEYDHRHGYRGPEGFANLPAAGQDPQDAGEESLQGHELGKDPIATAGLETWPREGVRSIGRGAEVKSFG